jgi:hypothetical protein
MNSLAVICAVISWWNSRLWTALAFIILAYGLV